MMLLQQIDNYGKQGNPIHSDIMLRDCPWIRYKQDMGINAKGQPMSFLTRPWKLLQMIHVAQRKLATIGGKEKRLSK